MTFFYTLNKKLAEIADKAQPQTLNEGREEVYREYQGDVQEKWDTDTKVSPEEKGKYKGKSKAELQKQYNALKARGPHKKGSPDFGKMRELAFAIRAKSGWGKVDEGDIDPNRHPQTRDYGTGEPLDDEGRRRDRRELATDVDTLDRLERQALKRGAQVDEADFEEGNEFSGELARARAAGKDKFEVDGKEYSVKESSAKKDKVLWPGTAAHKEKFGQDIETFRKKHAPSVMKDPKGREELAKLDTEYQAGKKNYGRDEEGDDEDDGKKKAPPTGEKRGRGRPKGSKRAIGAKGPSGKSKLLTREDYDEDEYDEEGEMAKTDARTIEDAARELQSILDDQENLPEWVQKKISLAKDYVDRARDYMQANRPEDEIMAEKAVSKAQRAAAGIARAAQKGEIPRSELRGASKEMAQMEPEELRKFAKTKEKGLPEKVKEVDTGEADARKTVPASKDQQEKTFAQHRDRVAKEKQDHDKEEPVKETTTAGSVAAAPSEGGKKSKGGMQFGKGIYDSMNREVEAMISESMNVSINMNTDAHGGPSKSVTVTATDEDAEKLAALLRMAGLGQGDDTGACSACGKRGCGCGGEQVDENKPDWPTNTEISDDALQYSGGLNKPKSTGQTTTPVIAGQEEREHSYEEDEIQRLRERAGIFAEAKKKPDFPDLDKDGDKSEPMSKAIKDKESKVDEAIEGSLWNLYKRLQ
jgi:hypothetical protein